MTTSVPPVLVKRPGFWALRIAILAVSMVLILIACCCPAVYYVQPSGAPYDPSSGFLVLLIGAMAIFYGCAAWYANCLLFLAWIFILCRLWLTAAIVTGLGILIALDTYSLIGKAVDADEGGSHKIHVTAIGPAFHVWLAAFIATLLGALLLKILSRKPRQIVLPV